MRDMSVSWTGPNELHDARKRRPANATPAKPALGKQCGVAAARLGSRRRKGNETGKFSSYAPFVATAAACGVQLGAV
jgi:hypothetical protein